LLPICGIIGERLFSQTHRMNSVVVKPYLSEVHTSTSAIKASLKTLRVVGYTRYLVENKGVMGAPH